MLTVDILNENVFAHVNFLTRNRNMLQTSMQRPPWSNMFITDGSEQ